MARNLLAETSLTNPFAHFPDGPNQTIHTSDLQPIFEGLEDHTQDFARRTVSKYDPRGGEQTYGALAVDLGVQMSVAYGLMTLLHPDA